MAKASSITPPFAWLGRFWAPVGLTLITLVAAFFRFYQLSTLPPGLDETAARIGTQAIALTWAHPFPQLNAANGYSPLWVWLQAVSIHAVGRTTVALLLISALLGTLSIIVTWFWLRDWFDTRIAWLGATTLAVSPWATTLSRSGLESVLPLFLYPLTLWLSSRALKSPSLSRYILVGLAMGLDVLSGPLGILFAAVLCFIAVLRLVAAKKLLAFSAVRLAGLGVFALALAVSGYLIGQSLTAVRALPHDLNIVSRMSDLVANFGKVLLMFNVHGDDNYRHNLAGEPMLNAFVGLMMVTGLLVSISRMHRLRYRVVPLHQIQAGQLGHCH
jgi:4-amino-4-deoxy-L-arabinose transferase-like glycosyltransferase